MTGTAFFISYLCQLLDAGIYLFAIQCLNYATNHLKTYDHQSGSQYRISACLLLMILLLISRIYVQVKNDWWLTIWQARLKTTLQYTLFSKALRTKQFSSDKEEEEGENVLSEEVVPDVNNLITVDVEQLQGFCWACQMLVSSIIEIIVILYMLYLLIDSAILKGIYVILGAMLVNIVVSVTLQQAFKAMFKHKDRRTALSTDIIEGMKSIKYLCWERIFERKV